SVIIVSTLGHTPGHQEARFGRFPYSPSPRGSDASAAARARSKGLDAAMAIKMLDEHLPDVHDVDARRTATKTNLRIVGALQYLVSMLQPSRSEGAHGAVYNLR